MQEEIEEEVIVNGTIEEMSKESLDVFLKLLYELMITSDYMKKRRSVIAKNKTKKNEK